MIFDMDGLLFDTETIYRDGYKITAKKLGVEITDDIFETLMGRGMDQIIQMLDEIFEKKVDSRLLPAGALGYAKEMIDNNRPPKIKKGAKELIKSLKKRDFKLALGTSNGEEMANSILKSTGMYDVFDYKIYGDMVKNRKPNPDIFLKGCEVMGIDPSYCYVLEDSEMGMLASYNAGIDCIAVPDIKYPDKKYADLCLYIAKDLFEVKDFIFG